MLDLLTRLPGDAGGDGDILRESAIAVHTDNFDVAADMSLAGAALVALATGNVRLCGDKITRSKRGDFTPNLHNLTRKFMSKDARDLHATLCPGIPFVDMYICATDRGSFYLYQDIARANLRNIDKGNRRSRRRLGFEGRLHFTDHFSKILHDGVLLYASIMRLRVGDCKHGRKRLSREHAPALSRRSGESCRCTSPCSTSRLSRTRKETRARPAYEESGASETE